MTENVQVCFSVCLVQYTRENPVIVRETITILLVCCFSSSFNRFKPQVWQKPTPELSVLLEQVGSIIVEVVSIMKLHVCNALMVILQVNLGP